MSSEFQSRGSQKGRFEKSTANRNIEFDAYAKSRTKEKSTANRKSSNSASKKKNIMVKAKESIIYDRSEGKQYPIKINDNGSIVIYSDDVIKFFKNHVQKIGLYQYASYCRKETYEKIKYKDYTQKYYKNTKSRNQIQAILNISKTKKGISEYTNLLLLFSNRINVYNYSNFIISFLPKYLNDKSMIDDMNVYQNLKMFQNDNPKKLKQKNIRRKKSNNIINCWDRDTLNSQLYFSYMIGAIKRELMSKPTFKFKFDKYIDIGCGDCTLAIELGKLLEIPNKNIYGIDLPKWSQYDEKKRKNLPINIKTFNKGDKLPYKNKMFSFVTAIMVLHHVENLDLMMKEINRIMPIGGYFLFREHDAITYADYMLCDIEHMLYNIIKHNKDEKAFNDFYAKYYDKYEWQMILHKYGFAFIVGDYIYTDIKEKIRPTRAMYRVWKKVKEYDSDT